MGFFRVNINGTSPFPGEVWSVGSSWVGPNTVIPFPDLLAWATGIGTAIDAMAANKIIELISSDAKITEIRVEQRDDATEELIQAAEYTMAFPKAGQGTPSKNLQTAFVVSLITAKPGRSYRGRCYWPAWAYTGTSQMKFSTANVGQWLDGFKTIMNAVSAAAIVVDPAYQMALGVRSRLHHTTEDVGRLNGGDVPDTQRRRRDGVPELYSSITY